MLLHLEMGFFAGLMYNSPSRMPLEGIIGTCGTADMVVSCDRQTTFHVISQAHEQDTLLLHNSCIL